MRNDLQKTHVAWRIEKVRSAEIDLEILTATFRHEMDWNTRRIGCHQRAGTAVFIYFFKDLLFDVEPLDNYFDHPVTVFYGAEIIFKISCGNVFQDRGV